MWVNITKDKKKYKFDVKITITQLDVSELKIIFTQLKELKTNIRKFKKDSPEHKYMSGLIKQLKNETKLYAYMCYNLYVKLGSNYKYQRFLEPPTKENVNELINKIIIAVSAKRKERKSFLKEDKVLSGLKYTTVGGTFTKENTVFNLAKAVNTSARIKERKVPHDKIKTPYLGIELEIITKTDKDTIETIMIKNKLAGNVYLEHDGSIEPEEQGEEPQEITILVKQNEATNVIRSICKLLLAEPINSYVNATCGMHVHFDVRHRDPVLVYKNLVHMLPLLNQLVPRSRVTGQWSDRFCMQNPTDDIFAAQKVVTKHHNGGKARYQAINPMFQKYRTIEVRMHGGTINATKINSWIQLCLLAVESPKEIPHINSLKELTDNFKVTQGLIKFLEERILLFKENPAGLDVRADHFFFNKEA